MVAFGEVYDCHVSVRQPCLSLHAHVADRPPVELLGNGHQLASMARSMDERRARMTDPTVVPILSVVIALLALFGVIVSLLLQVRQLRVSRLEASRSAMLEIVKLLIDEPAFVRGSGRCPVFRFGAVPAGAFAQPVFHAGRAELLVRPFRGLASANRGEYQGRT